MSSASKLSFMGFSSPTTATTLLQMTNDATVLSGALAFQERVSFTGKDGGDRAFRNDLFSVDVNGRINLTNVGSAMLRAFDLPALRKDILREIRQTRDVPSIVEATFRELLDLEGSVEAGILPMKVQATESEPELVNV